MAQVTQDLRARAEWLLDYIDGACIDLIEAACQWDHWNRHERLEFRLGWPLIADKLEALRDIAERQLLTDAQQKRYEQLLETLAAHQPALDRLLAD